MLEVELLHALPADGVVAAWRALAVAAENPFASPEWLASWLETHRGTRPLILACRSGDGELVGVVPLVVDARGRLGSAAEALADWFGPACSPEHELDVALAAVAALRRGGHLARTFTMTRCLTGAGWLAGVHRAHRPEHELIATEPEVEFSLARFSRPPAMSGKQRREIARLRRRLDDAHEVVAFRCARTRPEAEEAFGTFERLHTQRWPDLRTPEVARFHRAFAVRAAEQGWLRLWALEIDGAPAAMLYGWKIGARSFAYMQAFDADWSRHGVGIVLLDHAVRAAEAEGSEVFDMLRGQGHHKARFENEQRTARTFVLVGRGSYARLAIHVRVRVRQVYRRLPLRHQIAIRSRFRQT